MKNMNLFPAIFSKSPEVIPTSVLLTMTKPRKLPVQRIFQHNELEKFRNIDSINDFPDANETLLKSVGSDHTFVKYENHAFLINYKRTAYQD